MHDDYEDDLDCELDGSKILEIMAMRERANVLSKKMREYHGLLYDALVREYGEANVGCRGTATDTEVLDVWLVLRHEHPQYGVVTIMLNQVEHDIDDHDDDDDPQPFHTWIVNTHMHREDDDQQLRWPTLEDVDPFRAIQAAQILVDHLPPGE